VSTAIWSADPIWAGEAAVVIASGPSLTQADVDLCRGRRMIAVNDNWRRAPWADCLFAADRGWWERKGPAAGEFAGMRVTIDAIDDGDAHQMLPDPYAGLCTDRRKLAAGSNSGGYAVNLAFHFGANPIVLLGFDMKAAADGRTHWFGSHPEGLCNPDERNFDHWRTRLRAMGQRLKERGVDVINATRDTALTGFRQMDLEDALRLG
jgi:hypothetical protein